MKLKERKESYQKESTQTNLRQRITGSKVSKKSRTIEYSKEIENIDCIVKKYSKVKKALDLG